MSLTIREYRLDDTAAVLLLFDGNTPEFFASTERSEFVDFLAEPRASLLVVEAGAAPPIVGFGGYFYREEDRTGGLAWGMVSRGWHRKGVGRFLLQERLTALRGAGAHRVRVRTSQRSRGFFERSGFVVQRAPVPNGFAPGIDLVELWLDLHASGAP